MLALSSLEVFLSDSCGRCSRRCEEGWLFETNGERIDVVPKPPGKTFVFIPCCGYLRTYSLRPGIPCDPVGPRGGSKWRGCGGRAGQSYQQRYQCLGIIDDE